METSVKKFILENWDNTIRQNTEDNGTLLGVPYPYTVPCIQSTFQEMYYWDTYFTNVGLILSGRTEQAINNVENMAYMIEKHGKMLNGTRTYYLNRSQPPFFTQMIREIFEVTGDIKWLKKIYPAAEKEHVFWQSKRTTPSGLNRYYCDDESYFNEKNAKNLADRCHIEMPTDEETVSEYAKCMLSFAESGWDCNSRFGLRAHKFNPVCLNSLLYGMEENLAFFSEKLENGKADEWHSVAEKRKALMNKLMWNEENGAFCDYDFENGTLSDIFSAASFYPMTFNMATKEQATATVKQLSKLETDFGITGCENKDGVLNLQWDYPNGWACLHHMVIKGLLNYGYETEAKRLAGKYSKLVEDIFDKTGNLWEKYDVVNGTVSTAKEYATPTMMGWSAGVYMYVCSLTDK